MVRSTTIQDIGLLDENIVMYVEEMDWCRRMWDANWQVIFCPSTRVVHYGGGSSTHTQPWVLARQWQSMLYFMGKHHGRGQAVILRIYIAAVGLLRAFAFGLLTVIPSRGKWLLKAKANLNLARMEPNYDY
jgi:GT2 family glycosyltransferase